MKKNKTVAFMLAATLMVGGTFLGTKAWFTDQGIASNNLVITMGNLDIEVSNDVPSGVDSNASSIEGWYLVKNGNVDDNSAKVDINISNLKPGDKLVRKIKVENKGSLAQEINVTTSSSKKSFEAMKSEFKKFGFDFKYNEDILALKELGVGADKIKYYNLELEVPNTNEDNTFNTSAEEKVELNKIIGTITIKAKQADANSPKE